MARFPARPRYPSRVMSPPVASAVTAPSASGGPPRPEPLDTDEVHRLDVVRRFGTVGSLLMGVGALGAGTTPVLDNPVAGRPVLGLLIRMPTASLAVAYTGIFLSLIHISEPTRPY